MPVITESIETINNRLRDFFGLDTISNQPIWRVIWSDDQTEMRRSKFTPSGIELIHTEVMEFKKYPWIKHRYVLEQLVLIPEINLVELPGKKVSYEPMWVFEDRNKNVLAPAWWACKFVVDSVYAAKGQKSMAKYVDNEAKNPIEAREKRIKKLEEELFGDESSLMLRTVTGEASVMPQNYTKEMQK